MRKTKHSTVYSIFLSILSLAGINFYFSVSPTSGQSSYSLITVLLFAPVFLGTKHLFDRLTRRIAAFSAVTGMAFSLIMTAGAMLYKNDRIEFSLRAFSGTLCLALFFFIISGLIITLFSDYADKAAPALSSDLAGRIFTGSKKYFLFVTLFIFICWIPVFLAFYPGIFNYDAITQINEVRKDVLSSHHPVLHTLFLYVTIDSAGTGAWSPQTGMVIHSLVQMLILAFSMGYACKRMAKWKAPYLLQAAAILFFAFFPVNALLALCTTKDIIFSALFLVLTCMTVDLVIDSGKLRSPVFLPLYILTAIASCLFRNTGIYILAVGLVILLFAKKCRKYALIICGVSIAAVMIITGPVQSLAGIEKGDAREALCVPIQQLSRAYINHPERFSDDDREFLTSLIPEEVFSSYSPRNADFIKNNFKTAALKNNLGEFIKLWVKTGLRSPKTYVESYLSGSFGYWYPDMVLPDSLALFHPYIELNTKDWGPDFVQITPDSKLPAVNDAYTALIGGAEYKDIPLFSILFSPGFMFCVMIISAVLLMYFKKYAMLLPILPGFLLWGTFTLSPVVLIRYAYPLFLCSIIYLSVLFYSLKKTASES